jgi:putative effector of murein hydrolase
MTEQLALLFILLFITLLLSQFITRMMKSGNKKFKIPVLYGRVLLGFLLSMFAYLVFLMLKGENIITKLFGPS